MPKSDPQRRATTPQPSRSLAAVGGIDVAARRVTFTVTDSLDAHGTRILPAGLRLERYQKNPIFCWMHRTSDGENRAADPDDVIGRVVSIALVDNQLVFSVVFGTHDLAERCFQAVVEGRLNACSISFDPITTHDEGDAVVVDAADLVEISLVIIGSNPDALALRAFIEGKRNMNPDILKKLGLAYATEPQLGDIMVALCQYLARSDEDKALVDEVMKALPQPSAASEGAEAAAEQRAAEDKPADAAKGDGKGDDLMSEVKRLHSRMDEMEKRSAPTAVAAAVRAELAKARLNTATRPAAKPQLRVFQGGNPAAPAGTTPTLGASPNTGAGRRIYEAASKAIAESTRVGE